MDQENKKFYLEFLKSKKNLFQDEINDVDKFFDNRIIAIQKIKDELVSIENNYLNPEFCKAFITDHNFLEGWRLRLMNEASGTLPNLNNNYHLIMMGNLLWNVFGRLKIIGDDWYNQHKKRMDDCQNDLLIIDEKIKKITSDDEKIFVKENVQLPLLRASIKVTKETTWVMDFTNNNKYSSAWLVWIRSIMDKNIAYDITKDFETFKEMLDGYILKFEGDQSDWMLKTQKYYDLFDDVDNSIKKFESTKTCFFL